MNAIVAKAVIFPTEPSKEEKEAIRNSNMFNGEPHFSWQWRADIKDFPTAPNVIDIAGFLIELGYKSFEFKNGAIYADFS